MTEEFQELKKNTRARRVHELEEDIRQRDREIKQLRAQLDPDASQTSSTTTSSVDASADHRRRAVEEIKLRHEVAIHRDNANKWKQKCALMGNKLREYEQREAKLTEAIATLSSGQSYQQAGKNADVKSTQELGNVFEMQNAKISQLQERVEELERDVNESTTTNAEITRSLVDSKRDLAAAQMEVNNLRFELAKFGDDDSEGGRSPRRPSTAAGVESPHLNRLESDVKHYRDLFKRWTKQKALLDEIITSLRFKDDLNNKALTDLHKQLDKILEDKENLRGRIESV